MSILGFIVLGVLMFIFLMTIAQIDFLETKNWATNSFTFHF